MPANDDLTPSENAMLIVLMSEARDISNPELKDRFKFTIDGRTRKKLNDSKYVESWREGRAFVHRLGEKGWARCREELDFDSPRARVLGAALTSLLGAVQRDLARTNRSPADAFGEAAELAAPGAIEDAATEPAGEAATEPAGELEARIRGAYRMLASQPGGWVSLTDLRSQLDGVPRADVDAALRRLELAPDVNVVPESNQKALTQDDRQAAVHIGGQDKHFLAIGV